MSSQANRMILIYDGECMLCHRLIRFVIKFDRQEKIKLAHIHSVNKSHDSKLPIDTISLSFNGQIYHKSKAVTHVMSVLGFPFNVASSLMKIVPTSMLDFLYDFVAKNRNRWSANETKCPIIDDSIQHRLYHELDQNTLQ